MRPEAHAALEELERKWEATARAISEVRIRSGKTGAKVIEPGLIRVPK